MSTSALSQHHADRLALSPAEAANELGVSRQHIYNLIDRGVLTRYKIGRATRLNAAEVRSLVGGGPDAPTAA